MPRTKKAAYPTGNGITEQFINSAKNLFFNVVFLSAGAGFVGLGLLHSSLIDTFPGFRAMAYKTAIFGLGFSGTILFAMLAFMLRRLVKDRDDRDNRAADNAAAAGKRRFSIFRWIISIIGLAKNNLETVRQLKGVPRDKKLPPLELLPLPPVGDAAVLEGRTGMGFARQVNAAFRRVGLLDAGERISVVGTEAGPVAARITIGLPDGLRLTRLQNLTKDLSAAFGVPSLQVMTGKKAGTAAFILPHKNRLKVYLRPILETEKLREYFYTAELPIVIGVDDVGSPVLTDLVTIRHLLVGGATGAGKSWFINEILVTLITSKTPDELKFVLIDPKKVELRPYHELPHTLKVATEVKDAVEALQFLVVEMDRRYREFEATKAKNIQQYRSKASGKDGLMPYIICVIDELADLMVQAKKDVEPLIQRLAQLARAAGIHLIVATQRPSVDVITGVIKANLPSRIAFRMVNEHDFRTVLGFDPKVELVGKGDGLALLEGANGLQRFQSPGVGGNDQEADEAIERLVEYWNGKYRGSCSSGSGSEIFMAQSVSEKSEGTITLMGSRNENEDLVELPALNILSAVGSHHNDENENHELYKLKSILAESWFDQEENEEKRAPSIRMLRTALGIKQNRLLDLMQQLVNEGWLEPSDVPRMPYRLVADEEMVMKLLPDED